MAAYALGVTLLIHFLHKYVSMNNHRCKEVVFSDDFTTASKIEGIRSYWELLKQVGPFYGYFSNPFNLILWSRNNILIMLLKHLKEVKLKLLRRGKTFRSSNWK